MHDLSYGRYDRAVSSVNMRTLIKTLLAALAFVCASWSVSHALPSSVAVGKDAVDWKIDGVLIWRFPTAAAPTADTVSARFDEVYKKGFKLNDVKVVKHDGKWTLCIGKKQILACDKAYSRGAAIDEKTMGVMMLSRMYEAIGKMHALSLGAKHKIKGVHSLSSKASWYGGKFIGRKCANGEVLTETHLCTAAKDLPFGTLVRVTVPSTKRSVVVRVTDRFAERKGRAIDVSVAAAELLGIKRAGIANVKIDVIGEVGKIGGK